MRFFSALRDWFNRERGDESVTLPGHGLDEFLAIRRLAERLANRVNVVGEIGFLDGGVGPHFLDQLILRHQAARVCREHGEHVKCLRRERHWLAVPEHETFGRDERDRGETDRANG